MNGFYIKRLENAKDLDIPTFASIGSAGMDLYANIFEDTIIKSGEIKLVNTGIKISIPIGYEVQIRPRSGLALKHGVTVLNAPGTIDSDYRGEIGIILINHGENDFIIKRGDRIAQMVINEVIMKNFIEVDTLDETARGSGGFGHSGVSNSLSDVSIPLEDCSYVNDIFSDIDSYKDNLSLSKVIKFFEMKDIYFTKTMIQNYNKIKALPPLLDNRYYTREHLIYLYYIDYLKKDYQIDEIKNILYKLSSSHDLLKVHKEIIEAQKQIKNIRELYLSELDKSICDDSSKSLLKMVEVSNIKNI